MKPRAMIVIERIRKLVGAGVCQDAESHLPEGIYTDRGCNKEAITMKK
jgi:hypothetical protein